MSHAISSRPTAVLAIGELLWDLLPAGPRLGGATTNFAVLSARLGAAAVLVSSLGNDDLGRQARAFLEVTSATILSPATSASRLDLTELQTTSEFPTGTVEVTLSGSGQPQYVIHDPAAWDGILLTPGLSRRIAHADAVYFGTLAQRNPLSRLTIRAVIEGASATTVRICDLNLRSPFVGEEIIRWSLQHCDILKVSEEELPLLAQTLGWPQEIEVDGDELDKTVAESATKLFELAPECRLLAMTLGARGSYIADRERAFRHHGFPTQVQDTVGAGDAFTAGLLHAYLRGGSLEQMSLVANRCGSFVAGQSGATPVFPAPMLETLQQVFHTEG